MATVKAHLKTIRINLAALGTIDVLDDPRIVLVNPLF
jgi:hypothetical protein